MDRPRDERNIREQIGYAMIPHAITQCPDLSDGAFRTYVLLIGFWRQSKKCWPGIERLATIREVSERQIQRHIQEMVVVGIVERRRRVGKSSLTIIKDWHDAFQGKEWYSKFLETRLGYRKGTIKVSKAKKRSTEPDTGVVNEHDTDGLHKKKQEKKKQREGGKAPSPHHEYISWMTRRVEEKFGTPYHFTGGKDGMIVKRLMKTFGLERLKQITEIVMQDEWVQERGFSMGMLSGQANQAATRIGHVTKGDLDDQIQDLRQEIVETCKECRGTGRPGCPCMKKYQRAVKDLRRRVKRRSPL